MEKSNLHIKIKVELKSYQTFRQRLKLILITLINNWRALCGQDRPLNPAN